MKNKKFQPHPFFPTPLNEKFSNLSLPALKAISNVFNTSLFNTPFHEKHSKNVNVYLLKYFLFNYFIQKDLTS